MREPFVSVIIPVFNDNERLALCLESIANQTYPKAKYEIILVDNNSDSSPADIISKFDNVILETEQKNRGDAARNKGLSVAKGEVIAFTDSDCIPAPDWIEKGVSMLVNHSDYGIVGGRLDVYPRNPEKISSVEMWDIIFAFNQKSHVEEGNFAVTANLFTRKNVFNKVGTFDDKLFTCGDQEWGKRAFSHGIKIIYGDDVVIRHPARHSLKQFCKKEKRIISGTFELESMSRYPWLKHIGSLVRDLIPPFEGLFVILFNSKFRRLNEIAGITGVEFYQWYLWIHERVRLMAGGNPGY